MDIDHVGPRIEVIGPQVGAWAEGSTTREEVYQDGQSDNVRAAAAAVRDAWRTGANPESTAPGAQKPVTAAALLAALPENLRAEVVAGPGESARQFRSNGQHNAQQTRLQQNAAETRGFDGDAIR